MTSILSYGRTESANELSYVVKALALLAGV